MVENSGDRLTPEQLNQVIAKHEAFLNSACEGERANLAGKNLAGLNLSNRVLLAADFSGANLTGTSLKFSNLSEAALYCCDMARTDGRYVNFAKANMRGVNLNGANLSHARLDGCDFRAGQILRQGPRGNVVVDRSGAAVGTDFSYCSLVGVSFEGADLQGANFTGAVITGSKFRGAKLGGSKFKGAVLTDVDITDLALPPDVLKSCVLPPSANDVAAVSNILLQLKQHQHWIDSDGRAGKCGNLEGRDLRPLATTIGKFRLTALSMPGVIAAGVDFSCTELQGANFEGADLRGASFEGADLRGARFKGALLYHAKFLGADMRALELKTGGVLECELSDTDFNPEQRAEAVFV
jgi:uncharacterized protein YjbI with pentapeptide repeats